MKYLSLITS